MLFARKPKDLDDRSSALEQQDPTYDSSATSPASSPAPKSDEERNFVHRLDLFLMVFVSISQIIKYLDQSNFQAAYGECLVWMSQLLIPPAGSVSMRTRLIMNSASQSTSLRYEGRPRHVFQRIQLPDDLLQRRSQPSAELHVIHLL